MSRLAAWLGPRVDAAFLRASFEAPGRRGKAVVRHDKTAQHLDEVATFYQDAGRRARLFACPAAARASARKVRRLPGGIVEDLSWRSSYVPVHRTFRDIAARYPANATVRARALRHDRPAPGIIVLHGWGMGVPAVDEVAFRSRWFYRQGFDVALLTMPFHAARLGGGRVSPAFPTNEPIRTTEGFAQAVSDTRALAALMRQRSPYVGVTGMSLGGFTSALLATVEPSLDFVMPMLPFARYPDLLWDHAQHGSSIREAEAQGITRERFSRAFAAVDPLLRAPVVPCERIMTLAGRFDRVTPPEYAETLHQHFEGSRHTTFAGSHLLQLDRRGAFGQLLGFAEAAIGRATRRDPRDTHHATAATRTRSAPQCASFFEL